VCVSPKDLTGYSVTETSLDRSSFKVQVACADTHTGTAKVAQCTQNLGTYSITGCSKKIECASPNFEGYTVTEQNTVAQTFDVPATCARGYEGTAVATACSKTGEKYTLSGCKYSTTTCAAPKATDGYLVTEAQLRKILFDVSVQCAPGYQGAAKVAPCTGDGKPYTLTGCSPAPVCVSPKDLTGYSVTEASLDRGSFKVEAKCSATHIGEPKVTECTSNLGTYSITGCVPKIQCTSPSKDGYAVTETSTVAQHFVVPVSCARGYEGKAVATACSKTGEPYTLSGCKFDTTTCVAPSKTQGYMVTEAELRKSIFDVQVQCAPGFTGAAKVTKCNLHGEAYTLSGCSAVPFCVAPKDVEGYEVTETSLDRDSFNVKVKCAKGYSGSASVTKCSDALKSYSLAGCQRIPVCLSPRSVDGYMVSEHSMEINKFNVQVACAPGYHGTPKATVCGASLQSYSLSGCSKR